MLHSEILPQTSKKFTQINLSYLWHFATLDGDNYDDDDDDDDGEDDEVLESI